MKKLFEKIDALPIVKLLQLTALVLLVVGLGQTVNHFLRVLDLDWGFGWEDFFTALMLAAMTAGRVLFEPVFLLGLAEVIKLMKEKNAKNN